MTHIIIRDVALVTDLWCFGSSFGSGAPRMSVAGPSRRLPSCRRRKRLRPGVGWWGSPVRFIVDLGCGYPFLVWFVFLWLLFSGVWETLIFGTGDWFAFGEPFFCGLFTPTNPLPGHRLVPESQERYTDAYAGLLLPLTFFISQSCCQGIGWIPAAQLDGEKPKGTRGTCVTCSLSLCLDSIVRENIWLWLK